MKHDKYLRAAMTIAEKSNVNHRHGAVIIDTRRGIVKSYGLQLFLNS
jgi:hypothetical protein